MIDKENPDPGIRTTRRTKKSGFQETTTEDICGSHIVHKNSE